MRRWSWRPRDLCVGGVSNRSPDSEQSTSAPDGDLPSECANCTEGRNSAPPGRSRDMAHRTQENQMVAVNAVLLILAVVVAGGRFGPYAF